MSTLIIRRAKPEDFAAIWPIFEAVVQSGETYAYDPATPYEVAQALWMGGPGVDTYLALSGDAVVGTYRLGPNQPGLGDHVANAAYMVAPAARGRGIGRSLAEHSFERARARGFLSMVFNLVVASNHGAVALWQALGFRVVGTLREAYRHARLGLVDAYVLQRPLHDPSTSR